MVHYHLQLDLGVDHQYGMATYKIKNVIIKKTEIYLFCLICYATSVGLGWPHRHELCSQPIPCIFPLTEAIL